MEALWRARDGTVAGFCPGVGLLATGVEIKHAGCTPWRKRHANHGGRTIPA